MNQYSNKLTERILTPKNGGHFAKAPSDMRLVIGRENGLTISILVDESDGIIADVKFQAYGGPALIGAADIACEMILRKNYGQASRITADMIDHKLRDFSHIPAFPDEAASDLNTVLSAIEQALEQCYDIEISEAYLSPPVPVEEEASVHPGWDLLSSAEKLKVIEQVIADDIQPYIELDAGGVEVHSFEEEKVLTISYQGACTTCPSATGATLDAITHTLRTKVHPSLMVKPRLQQ